MGNCHDCAEVINSEKGTASGGPKVVGQRSLWDDNCSDCAAVVVNHEKGLSTVARGVLHRGLWDDTGAVLELVFLKLLPGVPAPDPPSARDVVLNPGQTLSVVFSEKPLGLAFRPRHAPLTVSAVAEGSVGEMVGVEVGMKLLDVCDQSLSGLPYQTASFCLLAAMESLPIRADSPIMEEPGYL